MLFGSIARGDAVPGSDVDLLVVLANSEEPFLDRLARYHAEVPGLGVEVFPYTEDEIGRLRKEAGSLVSTALSEGVWVVGQGSGLRDPRGA